MSEPFVAEIKIIGFDFAPRGWAYCDGQLLPINQNQALYSLLGTTYGGDGRTNFALPDLRSRTPIHEGNAHALGERSGSETVTLTTTEIPTHIHNVSASSTPGDTQVPAESVLGGATAYITNPGESTLTAINPGTITNVGGSQAHENMQPYTTLGFVIALQGLFPSRS